MIISSLDHTDVELPVQERLALAMKHCGVSITCEFFRSLVANVFFELSGNLRIVPEDAFGTLSLAGSFAVLSISG